MRIDGPKYLTCHCQKSNDLDWSHFKISELDRVLHSFVFLGPHTLRNIKVTPDCVVNISPAFVLLAVWGRGSTLGSGAGDCHWQMGLKDKDRLPLSLSWLRPGEHPWTGPSPTDEIQTHAGDRLPRPVAQGGWAVPEAMQRLRQRDLFVPSVSMGWSYCTKICKV